MEPDLNEQRRLQALARYDVLDTPRERDFDDIAKLASEICATPIAVVNLIADRRQFFKAEVGLGVRETPFESSFCAKAILEQDFLIVPDATKDHRFDCNPLVTGEPHLRFYAGAILKTADNYPIGTVCVLDYKPHQLTELQKSTLRVLARQVMIQLELRRALAEKSHEVKVERRLSSRRLARAAKHELAMDQLRSEDERARTAQTAGRVGIFALDITSNMMTVSEEFCRIFGVPHQKSYAASTFEGLIIDEDRRVGSDMQSRLSGSARLDVDYRIRRADDGALRWVSRRSRFVEDEAGNMTQMVGVVFDSTDGKLKDARTAALLRLGDELREADSVHAITRSASDILADGLGVARAGYATVDQTRGDFVVEFNRTSPGATSIAGRHAMQAFAATMERLSRGNTLAIANIPSFDWLDSDSAGYAAIGTRSLVNVPILKAGKLVGVLFAHDDKPRSWTKDELDFAYGVADRTYGAVARVQAQDEQRVLNQELSHRLKNTLAMVQAIASQTLRDVSDRAAVEAFSGRIQALSSAHDILLQQAWSAAKMHEVIAKILDLHVPEHRRTMEGPEILLGPKAGLSLSLLLHELATNAQKYGAFSNDAGRVSINWDVAGDTDGTATLSMTWTETGGPDVSTPTTRGGFGSRLIRMGLVGTGRSERDYRLSGLVATFQAPMALMTEMSA